MFKFCSGQVPEPTYRTAKRIAEHYKLPLAAIYESKVASFEATKRLGVEAAVIEDEAQVNIPESEWPLDPFISQEQWHALPEAHRNAAAFKAFETLASIGSSFVAKDQSGKQGSSRPDESGVVVPSDNSMTGHRPSSTRRLVTSLSGSKVKKSAHQRAPKAVEKGEKK